MLSRKTKTPSENFEILMKYTRMFASICGLDLLDPNYSLNWLFYSLIIAITFYYIFAFLTIYNNYKNDWSIILRATVTMGCGFQGISKIFSYIKDRQLINNLYELVGDIYRTYEKKGTKYWQALEASMEKTHRGVFYLTLFYTFGYGGTILLPYLILLTTGERYLVIEFQVPGLDIETDTGYFITLVFQTFLFCGFAVGLYSGDVFGLIYLLKPFLFAYLFEIKIEHLNDIIAEAENKNNTYVNKCLKEIIEWHQLYSDYTRRCNGLFYYIITVQVFTSTGAAIISTYLIIAGGWPGAYPYVLIAFCCLYVYCILGTETEKANEFFENVVQNIHWYNLNVSQQKIVLQLITITQTPQIIDVAGIMPLSVSTALQISKTVYSITMFMIEFLKN